MTIPSNAIPVPISGLPPATNLQGGDLVLVVSNNKTSVAQVSQFGTASGSIPNTATITAGGALSGGGLLVQNPTISLNTINAGGTVGNPTTIPSITWDTYGRVTGVNSVTVATPSLQQVLTIGGNTGQEDMLLDTLSANAITTNSLSSGSAVFGSVTVNSSMVLNAQPVNPMDVVRLVDLQRSQVITFRDPVTYVATTSIGTTYTRNTGVGTDTITGNTALVIDGVTISATPATATRVLLVGQGSLTGAAVDVSNGPYLITTASPTGFTLTRTNDPVSYGNYYFVTSGSTYDATSWVNNTSITITVGVTPLTYVEFFSSPNAGNNTPLTAGTATAGLSVSYARQDHVHPISPITVGSPLSGALAFTLSPLGTSYSLGVVGTPANATYLRSDGTWSAPAGLPYTAGNGISLVGTVFSAVVDSGRSIVVGATGIAISDSWTGVNSLGNPSITRLATVTVGTWNATPITVPYGGTGLTNVPLNNLLIGGANSTITTIAPTTNGNILTVVNGAWAPAPPATNGTVTTFSAVVPTGLAQSVATPTTTPVLTLSWSGQVPPANLGTGTADNTKYLRGDGAWTTFPTIPQGTVTSVAVTMPTGFVVSGSPITTSGTFAITYDTANRIPVASIASGVATTGFVPTVQANGTLAYNAPAEPLAVVYAIALG